MQQALEGLEGVLTVRVSLDQDTAEVIYTPAKVTIAKMIRELDNYGYSAKVLEIDKAAAAARQKKKNCGFRDAFC